MGNIDDIKRVVGKRIRSLRKEKRLSQEELGERASLHYTYLGGIERGETNASMETLDRIAKALGLEIVDLFDLPEGRINIERLRLSVLEDVKASSPEMLKLIAGFIEWLKNAKVPADRKSRKPRVPKQT